MIKYRVTSISNTDAKIGIKVGDLVRCSNTEKHAPIKLCILPHRLHGKGFSKKQPYEMKRNYWMFAGVSLKELEIQVTSDEAN